MGKLVHRILKMLNISGRDGAVLLLSLLLAFSIWLIHNLSLRYTEFLQASVEATSNIEGHYYRSSNRSDIIARCQTTGFNILRSGLFSGKRKITVAFDASSLHHKSGETYYITSSELKESAHLIFGDNVQIEYFITDTLFFRFPYEYHKRVPVNPVHVLSFRPQYTAVTPLEIEPDSVTVYGEPAHLNDIARVNTEAIKVSDMEPNRAQPRKSFDDEALAEARALFHACDEICGDSGDCKRAAAQRSARQVSDGISFCRYGDT